MVLATSHTISRSYVKTGTSDEYYDTFNDIALKHKLRKVSTRHERCFGKKQKPAEAKLKTQTATDKDEKKVKDDSQLKALLESPQGERGKSSSNSYLAGRRGNEKWREYYTKLSRYIASTPIYNSIHNIVENMGHNHPQDVKKGKINEHKKVKRTDHDKKSKTDHTRNNSERPPIETKRSLRKFKRVTVTNSRTTRRRYTSNYNKDITQILSEMSTKLEELRRLYSSTERSQNIANTDIIPINDAQYDDQSATTDTEPYEGTAAIEELLNEVKMRAVDMIANNLPSITRVIANAVTETTYTVDPMLKHTDFFSPLLALSTLVSINDFPDTVSTIDPTEPIGPGRDRDEKFRYFVSPTEPNRQERSAFANSTGRFITLTQNIEENLKGKLQSILDKIRGKAKPTNKNPGITDKCTEQKLKTDSKNLKKGASRPSEAKNIFDDTTNAKHKRERDITSSIATPFMKDSDYGMLALYERMLAKSQQSNMMKFLSTKLSPTLKRDLRKDPIENDENTEFGGVTSAPTNEETTYETLSKKLSYNDFVNGFKHYLKFEKEMGNSNFSNMVRYQAHRHHDVDKIGEYILDKIPQIPKTVQDRYRRGFDDNYDDDQDVSTKSEDSWFKRHFYCFMERSTPKKFHTSQIVPLKSPLKEWSSESSMSNSKDHEILKEKSVGKEKTESEYLDELSARLHRGAGNANLGLLPYSYNTEKVGTNLPLPVRFSRSPRLFHKILGMGRPTTKPSLEKLTPKSQLEEVNKHTEARVRRYDVGDKKDEAITTKNVNQTDLDIDKYDKKKLGYANVDIVPSDKKKKKKKGRIHKFFDKYLKKKKKKKGDKDCRSRRDVHRPPRFNIVHSLKKLFSNRPRSYLTKDMYDEDYDLTTKRLLAFKPIKYDNFSSVDDLSFDTVEPAVVEKTPTIHEDSSNESKMNEILKEIENIDLRVSTKSTYPITDSSQTLYGTERAKQKKPKNATTAHRLKPEYNVKIDVNGTDANASVVRLARYPLSKISDDYGIDTQIESSRVQVFNNNNNKEFKIQKQIDRMLKFQGDDWERNIDDEPRQATTHYHIPKPYEKQFRDYDRVMTTRTTQSDDYIESGNWLDALHDIGISNKVQTTTEANLEDTLHEYIDTKMIKPVREKWKENVNGKYIAGRVPANKIRQYIKPNNKGGLKHVTKNRNEIAESLNRIIGRIPQQSQPMETKYNQNLNGLLMDSTIFAYDDSFHLFTENASNKLYRSSIKPEMDTRGKTKLTPPQHYYTTPLPMEALEFDKFLKTNELDVQSLTLPLSFDTANLDEKNPKTQKKVKAKVIENTKVDNLEKYLVTPKRNMKSVKSKDSNKRRNITDFAFNAAKLDKSNKVDRTARPYLTHGLRKRKLHPPMNKYVKLNQKAKHHFKEPIKDDQDVEPMNFDNIGKLQDIHDSSVPLYDQLLNKDTLENMKLGKMMPRNTFSEDNFDRATVKFTRTTPGYSTNKILRETTNFKHNKLLHYSKVLKNAKKYFPKLDKHAKRIRIDQQTHKYDIEYVEDERLHSNEGSLFRESAPSIARVLTVPSSAAHHDSITSHRRLFDTLMNTRTYPMKIKAKEKTEGMMPLAHDYYSKQTTEMGAAFLEKLSEFLRRKSPKGNVARYAPDVQMKYDPFGLLHGDSLHEATTDPITTRMGLTRSFFDKLMGRFQHVTKSKNLMSSKKSPNYADNRGLQDDQMPRFTHRKRKRREGAPKVGKRQAKSFTAKSVEAIEVVIDLVQSTTSRPDRVVVDKDNGQNAFKNSVQLHIALPNHKTDENVTRPVRKLKKIFSAKMMTPVNLEYQIRTITYGETTASTRTTSRPPRMYLLVENVNGSGAEGTFVMKPLDQYGESIHVKARQADVTTAKSSTAEIHTEKITTTPTNKLSKVTLSKDFISAFNEHLQRLHEKANSNYSDHNIVSREVNHEKKRRWINWKKLKKYFQNERACNCKCRVGKSMCPACAASDAVMGELILEINNLVSYMNDHCTEIQTYFLMNPSGGKKLRDAVKKVDRSLQNYYKRVKGKCHGKTCDAIRCIDKRNFISYSRVPHLYIDTTLSGDIEKLAYDINNATVFNMCLDNKLKEGSYKLISLVSNCAEKPKVDGAQNKLVKNVYSLDNMHVNIVCNTVPTTSKGVQFTAVDEITPKDQMIPRDRMAPNDQVTHNDQIHPDDQNNDNGQITVIVPEYETENHRSGKLFVRYPSLSRSWLPHLRRTTSCRLKKRESEPNNIPLNADSGGSFWIDFFNKDRNKNSTVDNSFNKNSDDIGTNISPTSHVLDTKAEKTSNFVKNAENFLYTYTAMSYSEPELNPTTEQGAVQSLNDELDKLFKLLNIENFTERSSTSTRKSISATTKKCEDCSKYKKKKEKKKKCKCKCKSKSEKKTTKKPKAKIENEKSVSVTIVPGKTVKNKTTHPGVLTFQTKKVNADMLSAKIKGHDASETKTAPSELLNKIIKWRNALKNDHPTLDAGNLSANNNDDFLNLTVLDGNMSLERENFIQRRSTAVMRMYSEPTMPTDDNPTIIIVNENDDVNNTIVETTTKTDHKHVVNHDSKHLTTTATTNDAKKIKADIETNIYKSLLVAILKYEGKRLENELQRAYGKYDNSGYHKESMVPQGIINVRIKIVNDTLPQSVAKSTTPIDYGFLARLLQNSWSPTTTTTTESMINKIFNKLTVRKHFQFVKIAKGTSRAQPSTSLHPPTTTAAVNSSEDDDSYSEDRTNGDVTLEDYVLASASVQHPPVNPSLEQNQDETSEPPRLCDLHDTFSHILTALDQMNHKYFQTFIRNISCHKFKRAPEYFYITPDKTKRQNARIKWDWIRSKRSLLQVSDDEVEDDDSDDDVNTSYDEAHSLLDDFASNDGFEMLYKEENGVYRSLETERKKRTINDVKALSRELSDLPPIVVPKNEMYAMVGDSVTLICPLDVQEAPYSWWMESGLQDNVHVDGPRLFIRRATPENIGTYICSKDGRQLNSTRLRIVALPRFRIVFLPVYRSSRQCNNYDLQMVHQLGRLMTEAACPGKSCYVKITHPTCSRDETDSLLSLTATVVAAARALRRGVHVHVQGRRDLQCGLALLAAGNAPVLGSIPVIISSEEGNVTLSPIRHREGLRQVLRNTDWAVPAVSGLAPGEVDVVLTCPAGYFLVSCIQDLRGHPAGAGVRGRPPASAKLWQPSCLVLGACVVCGALCARAVGAAARAGRGERADRVVAFHKASTPAPVACPRRKISPSRVILPRLFRNASSRISQDTKLDFGSRGAPPLPPIDFDS